MVGQSRLPYSYKRRSDSWKSRSRWEWQDWGVLKDRYSVRKSWLEMSGQCLSKSGLGWDDRNLHIIRNVTYHVYKLYSSGPGVNEGSPRPSARCRWWSLKETQDNFSVWWLLLVRWTLPSVDTRYLLVPRRPVPLRYPYPSVPSKFTRRSVSL